MTSDRKTPKAQRSVKQIVILGPQLIPDDILAEGVLTPGDQRDIALDHITRTSHAVFHLRIVKHS